MTVTYHQQFWMIHTTGFTHKPSGEYVSYPEVIPVYVQNIGEEWDGTATFDIGPVDFSNPENQGKSWRWRRTHYENSRESEWLFATEDEARAKYERQYSEEARRIHATKKELHFINDNRVRLDVAALREEE